MIAGESVFNSVAGFTLYEAFLSVHHNYQGLVGRLLWIVAETAFSIFMGYGSGLVISLLLKLAQKRQAHAKEIYGAVHEDSEVIRNEAGRSDAKGSAVGLIFLFPWIAYLISEAMNLTGMITIFCCGISLGQYGMRNLDPPERKVAWKLTLSLQIGSL